MVDGYSARVEFFEPEKGVDCSIVPRLDSRLNSKFNTYGARFVRTYLHNSALRVFNEPGMINHQYLDSARDHLVESLDKNKNRIGGYKSFLIAILWGEEDRKMADIFSYSFGDSPWPKGNPDINLFTFSDGIWVPERTPLICGDTAIILGAEEEYRRTTESERQYFEVPPEIPRLKSILFPFKDKSHSR